MKLRSLSFSVITAVFLLLVGAFVVTEVRAQRTCARDADCLPDGVGLRCTGAAAGVSGRCNTPPPLWDASSGSFSAAGGQNVGFDVRLNSTVRGNLTVGSGMTGALFTNAIYGRGTAIDTIWIGDGALNDIIHIQGDLVIGGADAVPCTAGQILKRNSDGSRWVCDFDVSGGGGGGGGGGGSFDPCAVNLYRSVSPAVLNMSTVGGYVGGNGQCIGDDHVCTAEEILHTIACSKGRATPLFPASGAGWVSGGPPGDIATANDCNGWTSNRSTDLGRVWTFASIGGYGSLRNCNDDTLPFLCCR